MDSDFLSDPIPDDSEEATDYSLRPSLIFLVGSIGLICALSMLINGGEGAIIILVGVIFIVVGMMVAFRQ